MYSVKVGLYPTMLSMRIQIRSRNSRVAFYMRDDKSQWETIFFLRPTVGKANCQLVLDSKEQKEYARVMDDNGRCKRKSLASKLKEMIFSVGLSLFPKENFCRTHES